MPTPEDPIEPVSLIYTDNLDSSEDTDQMYYWYSWDNSVDPPQQLEHPVRITKQRESHTVYGRDIAAVKSHIRKVGGKNAHYENIANGLAKGTYEVTRNA